VVRLWLGWRFRDFDPDTRPERRARVAGLHLRVLPGVFDPSLHFSSGALAELLKRPGIVEPGASVLDIGTGSGILAVAAALAGAAQVVAIDINEAAVECARLNARRYGVLDQVSLRQSDMFDAVRGEKYDLVLVNPPYFRGEPATLAYRAYMAGSELEWIRHFGRGLPGVLNDTGRALMVVGDAACIDDILTVLREEQIEARPAGRRDYLAETINFFELRPLAQQLESKE
jgi:release factor glutamine methyltransferase